MSLIAFFDLEINPENKKILDIGAVRSDEATFHKNNPAEFQDFIVKADYLCKVASSDLTAPMSRIFLLFGFISRSKNAIKLTIDLG